MYALHRKLKFPHGLRGADIDGVCMVTVDADASGCTQNWLVNRGVLNDDIFGTAARCLDDLHRVVPLFADPASPHHRPYAAHYYGRLREMVRLIVLDGAHHADPSRSP
ncbi:hypothetical protein Lesp01_55860 [Lentzea sp. NBRC 102530]|nr:hypothetical protein Lesp01_55860 [Lentzea sp. NBRC 102530]